MKSTDKILPEMLPEKEPEDGADFLGIYERFDPAALSEEQLDSFRGRNPWIAGYRDKEDWYLDGEIRRPVPSAPAKVRAQTGSVGMQLDLQDLT